MSSFATTTPLGYVAAIGQREDLTDLIHNIAPTETPVLTAAGSSTAKAVTHDWQEDRLLTPEDNALLEGYVPTSFEGAVTTRLQNTTQLTSKAVQVTGDLEVVDKAGRDSEMAYQSALRAREMKTDVDFIICSNKHYATSSGTRTTASLLPYLLDQAGSGYAVGGSGTVVAGTGDLEPTDDGIGGVGWVLDISPEAFVQDNIDVSVEACWTNGGKPSLIVLGPVQKKKLSAFDGIGGATSGTDSSTQSTRSDRASRTIYATADVYVSNYGTLYVVPSRHMERIMPTDATNGTPLLRHNVFLIDPEYLKVAYMRPWQQFDLAKTGDNIRRQLVVVWTLEVCNRQAHGAVVNRTQS